METAKEWERWKDAAEIFLRENKKVFIKDTEGNIYFADIIFVGEDSIRIICFAPSQRKNKKITLYYPLITNFSEYEDFSRADEYGGEM